MAATAEVWEIYVNVKPEYWAVSRGGPEESRLQPAATTERSYRNFISTSHWEESEIFWIWHRTNKPATWGQETTIPWISNKSRPTWTASLDVKLGSRWGGAIRGGGIHCHGVITIFSNPEGKLKKSILISGACTRRSNRCTRFPTSAGSHGTTGVRQTTLNSFNN